MAQPAQPGLTGLPLIEKILGALWLTPEIPPDGRVRRSVRLGADNASAQLVATVRGHQAELRCIWNEVHAGSTTEHPWTDDYRPTLLDDPRHWLWKLDHNVQRQRMIQVVNDLRDRMREPVPQAATEEEDSGTLTPTPPPQRPAPLTPAPTEQISSWCLTAAGDVEVRFGSEVRRITARRRVSLFVMVARQGGGTVPWIEALKEMLQQDVDPSGEGQQLRVPLIDPDTLRKYGNKIQKGDLNPFGTLWQQDGSGARWTGGPEVSEPSGPNLSDSRTTEAPSP